jgi:hypothetical protein
VRQVQPLGLIAAAFWLWAAGAAASPAQFRQRGATNSDIGRSRVLKSYDQYVRVTLLSLRNPASSGDSYVQPDRGKKFVAVKLRITNLARRVYRDAPSNGATIVTTAHVGYDADLFEAVKPGLGTPRVAPRDSRVGWLTFEIPRRAAPWKFQFALDSGFSTGAEWRLR